MLSDRCLSVCLSCNVGVLWPNGWVDQDALGMEVGLGPGHIMLDGDSAPPSRVRGTAAPTIAVYGRILCLYKPRPMSIVAKRLYRSGYHLVRR